MAENDPQFVPLASHLARSEIFDRYRRSLGAEERTYWQIIYLKSLGKVIAEIAQVTGHKRSWVRQLIVRYNAVGPDQFVNDLPPTLATPALQADYARKTRELDTARAAQQSLLASPIPDHAELDIATFMRTATEVGGDYYDFNICGDGVLTIAIGDATGHDTKAGMMVTATKSLFQALGNVPDLLGLVRQLTTTLKRLNLRGLYMSLTVGRYDSGVLDLVVAGMPPAFVYRKDTGTVRQVVLKGMPLGAFTEFPYERCSIGLEPGDAVLLVTDGVTELVNPAGQMLTANRVQTLFAECGHLPAQGIAETIRRAGRAWRAEQALQDDATLMVLKRRED